MGAFFHSNIQVDKFLECLMYVNNDLGILLQNAENLAYKLGAIEKKDLNYLSYDYYNQFEQKDVYTLKKNIISSINFLNAQFIAIKQETGKDYIYPPSIEIIKKDVEKWAKEVGKISPNDVKYFNAIKSILNLRNFTKIKDTENVYNNCINRNNKTNVTPYMWMFFSPQILHNLDKNAEIINNKMESSGQSMPDIIRGTSATYKNNLIELKNSYREIKKINEMLKELNENREKGIEINDDPIKLRILDFQEKYGKDPFIAPENKEIYNKILENFEC